MVEGDDAFAEPAAVREGSRGDVDQSGVLSVEDAGDLSELVLVLEFVRRRPHADIVQLFDVGSLPQRMQINDR